MKNRHSVKLLPTHMRLRLLVAVHCFGWPDEVEYSICIPDRLCCHVPGDYYGTDVLKFENTWEGYGLIIEKLERMKDVGYTTCYPKKKEHLFTIMKFYDRAWIGRGSDIKIAACVAFLKMKDVIIEDYLDVKTL